MDNPYLKLTGGRHRSPVPPALLGRIPEGRELEEALDKERRQRNLTEEELVAYWNLWLRQAQATNDRDEALYSHGVFERDPAVPERAGEPS